MKKDFRKKAMAISVAAVMVTGNLYVPGFAAAETKWSEEETADGWIKVTNEGGKTLGYSKDSGVTLLEDDGYAFKDLNKNGKLDEYEDWRLDDRTRAESLANTMAPEEILPLLYHNSIPDFSEELTDATKEVLDLGQRAGVGQNNMKSPKESAQYANKIQAYVEEKTYGIPFTISCDPGGSQHDMMNYPSGNLAMAATFDAEYVKEIYRKFSEMYQAVGVSTLLGPQVDLLTEPRWSRSSSTFGEDPALSRDMTRAAVDGLQSTLDEDGNDLGWGPDSLLTTTKHFPGDDSGEGGRESHNFFGKYAVYPGGNFAAHLINFFDGALNLDGLTEEAASMMTSYSIAYSEDGSMGELVGTAFSDFKLNLLRDNGYDGLLVTDWQAIKDPEEEGTGAKPWGLEDSNPPTRIKIALEAGVDQIGGVFDLDWMSEAYELLKEDIGEEAAEAQIRNSARRIFTNYNRAQLFENPYVDSEAALALSTDADVLAFGKEYQQKSVVMLKNAGGVIHKSEGEATEKKTVYIPMTYDYSAKEWKTPVNMEEAEKYYHVITDTVGEPTGEKDEEGKATYSETDVIRATKDQLAEADMAIAFVTSPTVSNYSEGGYNRETKEYLPIALQYGEYVADSDAVRRESLAGDILTEEADDPYAEEADNPYAEEADNPYAEEADNPYAEEADNPYAEEADNPYAEEADNPYAEEADNPYAEEADNPYAEEADNPYAEEADNPYAEEADNPYAEEQDAAETKTVKENRSYYGKTAERTWNASDLDAILYARENIPEDAKLIVSIGAKGSMIMKEFEDKADVILVNFGWGRRKYEFDNDSLFDIIEGKVEPSGLLPVQMPADMETVESQYEDVPRDMKCHVDTEGNTYDFAFGLNWSGIISDERTEKYNVAPLTLPETITFSYAE